MARVSIITPTYNHARFIVDCIQSVQAQTYEDWEMLIVNDGSTDATAEIVARYIVNEPRIKLFNRANVGIFRLGETYNFALEQASGKYIAILEGDDVWLPEKLELQVKALEAHPDHVLAWGQAYYGEAEHLKRMHPSSPVADEKNLPYFNNTPVGNIFNVFLLYNCIPALTILIRKDALLGIGGFLQSFHLPLVDLPTLMALAKKGPFYFENRDLGIWRIYPNQVTKTYTQEIYQGFRDLSMMHYRQLPEEMRRLLVVDEKTIIQKHDDLILLSLARSGRYSLIRKEFKQARKSYRKAIFYKGMRLPIWRLRALVGYAFSLFRADVEGFAKLLGKTSYK